jgi:hypothetical protein
MKQTRETVEERGVKRRTRLCVSVSKGRIQTRERGDREEIEEIEREKERERVEQVN